MRILSDEEKRELREQRNLRIQEMKEVAAQQVINDLKRDMPEFEIQPEELIAALDINEYVRETIDMNAYIDFIRFYLWNNYNIVYILYKYSRKPKKNLPSKNVHIYIRKQLSYMMMNEIDNILSEIKCTLPTWPDGIILRQMDYFDGVFTKPIKSDAKNRSVIDILYHRLDKAKDKVIKKVMENYTTNYSGCKFYHK